MSLAAVAMTQSAPAGAALGPAGQYVLGPGDAQQPAIVGIAKVLGTGSGTTAVINFIDGTQTLPFLPSNVRVTAITGAANTDTSGVLVPEGSSAAPRVTSLTSTSFTVNYTTTPANTTISALLIEVYR